MPHKDPEKSREYQRNYKREQRAKGKPSLKREPFCVVTKDGRSIRGDVLDQYAAKKEGETSRQMPIDRFRDSYVSEKLVQPLYSPEILAGIIEINAYHARCCQVKARDTAGLGWMLVPLVENPSPEQKERLEVFINDQSGFIHTLYQHQYDIEVISYGALELVREDYHHDGEPVGLFHVPAHTLRVHVGGNKIMQRRANKKRYFKVIGAEVDIDLMTGEERPLGSLDPERRASEIIWNSMYSQRSDYYGIADIIPALGAVHGDMSRRDYNLSFFDNFGVPAYAVFITGDYDPGEIDEKTGKTELEQSIEDHFSELAENPHSTLILTVPSREGASGDVKIEFQPLSVETKDASFRLFRKDNRDEIITAHGVPPYRAGIAETGSLGGSTAIESTRIYKNSVIEPRQEVLEELLNHWIVREGFEVTDWAFQFVDIDTEDEKQELEIVRGLFDMGAMRIRDVIQLYGSNYGLEDDPDDPRLDMRFVKGVPLESVETNNSSAVMAMRSLKRQLLEVDNEYDDVTKVISDKDHKKSGESFDNR